MDINAIPLFSMIKGKLGHLSQRERLIAQNVANADTPGFTPTDLKPFRIQSSKPALTGTVAPATTNAAHLTGTRTTTSSGAYKAVDTPDSETTLDGNRVVLEEQMLKMAEARIEYDAAVGFYQKSLNLLRMAARPPGRV